MDTIDYKTKYEKLASRVKFMMQVKRDWLSSKKETDLTRLCAIEKEVKEIIDPPPTKTQQATFNWLAQ